MEPDGDRIADPEVRQAYGVYRVQRRILRDFFALLREEQFAFRLVDGPTRRSDSPRESLIHIIETQLAYLAGLERGQLDFDGAAVAAAFGELAASVGGTGEPAGLSNADLLATLDRLEARLLERLAAPDFNPQAPVEAPWGPLPALMMLYLMRDHDILHIGWNLALMDGLDLPRYESLQAYWS